MPRPFLSLVVGLLVGIIGCQRTPPPAPAASSEPPREEPVVTQPPATGPVYDLLPLIDPTQDTVFGNWVKNNGELRCYTNSFVPRIQIPYLPPDEYDFVVTFSQPRIRNGISLIMPKPMGGSFFWYLGGGPQSGDYGFASNPNLGSNSPGIIQPDGVYTTTVQVRREGVKGYLFGRLLVEVPTDRSHLTCDGWREIKDKRLLAVACDDPTIFHAIRIVEVTGQGKRIR